MNIKRLTAITLAVLMLATAVGCSSDKSWVAQLGEEKISAGVYSMNLMMGLNAAETASGTSAEVGKDDIFKVDIDGKTGSQYIIDYAKDETMRMLATDKKFKELGMEMSEEDETSYQEYAKNMYASDTEMFSALGVSEQSLLDYNRYSYQKYLLFDKLYSEGGEFAPPEEEAIGYFAENYYTAYVAPYLKLDSSTGMPLSEDALAEVRAKAAADLASITGGSKSIVDVVYEVTVQSMPEGSEIPERESGKDYEYQMVIDKLDQGYYPALLVEHLATAAIGEIKMIEDDQFIMIVQKQDENKVQSELANYYYSHALPTIKNEEYNAKCLEWANEYGVTFNDAAVKHYTGEKLKKDTDAYINATTQSSSSSSEVSTPQLSLPEVPDSSSAPESDASSDGSSSNAG